MNRIIILIFLCIMPQLAGAGEYYYTCSYAQPRWGTNIIFSKIDLDKKVIVFSKEIPITGAICFFNPPLIEDDDNKYFFLATIYGLPGHNTPAGNPYGYYALVTEDGNIVQIDSIPNTHFIHVIDTLKSTILYHDSTGAPIISQLTLDQDSKVVFNNIGEDIYRSKDYPIIGGFRYFNRIDPFFNRAYWNVANNGIYILLIDGSMEILIDSLNVSAPTKRSYLLGISPNYAKIYTFYIDCTCKGYEYYTEIDSIAPSYAKTFSSKDLSLIDSLNILNPCTDSICIDIAGASCHRVNDYLVYLIVSSVGIENFAPALLFIFDTRTNEATWLRVGWR
jgi:hypothetical protein